MIQVEWRTLALNAYEAIGHRVLVRYMRHDELEFLLAYHPERVADRRHAAAAASTEIEGSGTWSSALVDLLEGRWETALEVARTSFGKHDHESRYIRLWVYNVLGHERDDEELTAVIRDDIQIALPGGPATEPGPEQQNGLVHSVLAFRVAANLALGACELNQARTWITGLERWLDWSEAARGRAEAQLLWSRYHQVAGDAAKARQHAHQALEHASDPRQPLALITAHRVLGELDTGAGRLDESADHLKASLDLAERCEAPYEQALAILALAELAATRDDTHEAIHLLREARSICEPLGAQRSLERADQIEAGLRRRSTAHPAGLSDREVEVLEQAATGMTNAEIGEALYISPRTVAQHLRSVYNKLGVNSRAAAVARWAELTQEAARSSADG